mmetsp:Transcript_22815/g.29824  ORF Transcript_22815/g.29824 Transcript_22815/m.29824 type:complete len:96 (-) Transcript_22815:78-365(-)
MQTNEAYIKEQKALPPKGSKCAPITGRSHGNPPSTIPGAPPQSGQKKPSAARFKQRSMEREPIAFAEAGPTTSARSECNVKRHQERCFETNGDDK